MNDALKLVSVLLHSRPVDQQWFYTKQFPSSVFGDNEPYFRWLATEHRRLGCYPSARAFESRFNIKLSRSSEPLAVALQPLLDQYDYLQITKIVAGIRRQREKGASMPAVVAEFRQQASKIVSFDAQYVDVNLSTSVGAYLRYKDRVLARIAGRLDRLASPWASLNRLVGYFSPGEVLSLAARPAMGKTWTVLYWAHHLASQGVSTLVVTKEMPTEQIEDRMTAIHYRLPYEEFRRGQLSPRVLRRWHHETRVSRKLPLVVSGTESIEGVGLDHLIAKVEQYRPEVLVVDGAYLIYPRGSERMPRNERYAEISSFSKRLAKTLKVFVVLVLQMNRQAENEDGTSQGSLATLYGSDTWAQDSDHVVDISGRPGTPTRILSLIKSRESALGQLQYRYSLSPCPDFSEVMTVATSAARAQEIADSYPQPIVP